MSIAATMTVLAVTWAQAAISSSEPLSAQEIADELTSKSATSLRAVVGDRLFLEAGPIVLKNQVSYATMFEALDGCEVRKITEADRSRNVVVGNEPRIWWVCEARKPIGCFDIGFFGTLVDSDEGKALRVQEFNPRNEKRCPTAESGLQIGGSR